MLLCVSVFAHSSCAPTLHVPRPIESNFNRRAERPTLPAPAPHPGEWRVRLSTLGTPASLALTVGDNQPRFIRRVGNSLRDSNGKLAPWILVQPERGLRERGRIRIKDRVYPGSILLEPEPSGGMRITNFVASEDYVAAVVSAELAIWSAPPALLQTQAIAARSYALAQLSGSSGNPPRAYLFDSVIDQAYRGAFIPGSDATRKLEALLQAAAEDTRGLVLSYGNQVVDARFHAACGGTTAAFGDVFFNDADPGCMQPVSCPGCRAAIQQEAPNSVRWEWTASTQELSNLAQAVGVGPNLRSIAPASNSLDGRWLMVNIEGERASAQIPLVELRRILGWEHLKSGSITRTWPQDGRPTTGGLYFAGIGRGHGVGLCQEGARYLAEAGWSARKILSHYYQGAQIDSAQRLGP